MLQEKIKKQQAELIKQIHEYCPKLGEFFDLQMTLDEYSKSIFNFEKRPQYIKRQEELKNLMSNKIKKIFGDDALEKMHVEYDEHMAINIVDHHQVLNHPILISDNIVSHTDKYLQNKKQSATVVFSSGDVPPNNYFSKNGFMLNGKKVPIFSNQEKEYCTYYIPRREFDFMRRLKEQKRLNEFSEKEIYFLELLSDKINNNLDYNNCNDYKDQITKIVNATWPMMFEDKIRQTLPEIIYITQEEITTQALINNLNNDNFISETLFSQEFRQLILDAFRGIVVTWNEKENKGTHFFWHKHPSEPRGLRMYLSGDKLVPADGRYKDLSFQLTKNNVLDLLHKREIYPSLFLIFATLIFYYGVKPLVGHGSIEYLNRIKDVWLSLLEKSSFINEKENFSSVSIDKQLTGVTMFIKKHNKKYEAMYAHDVMFSGGITKEEMGKFFSSQYNDLLSTSINGIYDYVAQKYIAKDKKINPEFDFSDYFSLLDI